MVLVTFLSWQTVLERIPQEWKRLLRDRPCEDGYRELEIYSEIRKRHKTAKWSYKLLLSKSEFTVPNIAQEKWERDLRMQIAWTQVFKSTFETTTDFKLRWMQFRILHRILPTNRLLNVYGIHENGSCDRCPGLSENIMHVFWECPPIRSFWSNLKEMLHLVRPLSPGSVILGTCDKNGPLTLVSLRQCILLAKAYIWQCKCGCCVPVMNGFCAFAKKYLDIERYIAICTGKESKYNNDFGQLAGMLRRDV